MNIGVFAAQIQWRATLRYETLLYTKGEIGMTVESKYSRLNNQDENVTKDVSESTGAYSIEALLDIKNDLVKKTKRKKAKKKRKQVKKNCKKTRKELSVLKKDINRLKQSVYDNKLNELVFCNDPAERKKIATELKKVGVIYE